MQDGSPGAAPEPTEPEQIKTEIEQTREELGETVEALAERADLKAQAKAKVDERKQAIQHKQQELKGKAGEIPRRAREMRPEDAKRVASQTADRARARPGPAIAGALVAALFVLRVVTGRRRERHER
ncbi:MAG: DUF3618 domain-containing protein [Actinomycetota bacterium]|nr:DUF3618 domain-containing protein [Actinomycetota bacterium]